MESSRRRGPLPHGGDHNKAAVSAAKKKHRSSKLAALGVVLHRALVSYYRRHRRDSALLSCRSMDPAAAVVHPLPRDYAGGLKPSSSSGPRRAASLSCRSMDPAAAVQPYQYRPREVQFSCNDTPLHKRWRRAADEGRRRRRGDHRRPLELEYFGSSAAAVTRLFELMDDDVDDVDVVVDFEDDDDDGDDMDLDTAAAWPAPRQVRVTDSPFAVRNESEEEEDDDDDDLVDRRADEFITWFHEQLRTQTQQQHRSASAVREGWRVRV